MDHAFESINECRSLSLGFSLFLLTLCFTLLDECMDVGLRESRREWLVALPLFLLSLEGSLVISMRLAMVDKLCP